jgi:hypothetical protein
MPGVQEAGTHRKLVLASVHEEYVPKDRTTTMATGDSSWYTDSRATDHITSDQVGGLVILVTILFKLHVVNSS